MSDYQSPYPGINAHLNSALLQPDGGWEMFHAAHIIQLQQTLDATLPENYYAAPEKSLQVTVQQQDDTFSMRTIPDISIYQTTLEKKSTPTANVTTPTAILPLADTFLIDEEIEPNAVAIYQFDGGNLPGKLVTRIELLSTANKPGGSHYKRYMQRRRETLFSKVNLVEIDYLHHTAPLLSQIPNYPKRAPHATPYYVFVSNPEPSIKMGDMGEMAFYAIQVDEPLPRFLLPLIETENIVVDLQAVYSNTINSGRVFRLLANHERPLALAERYTQADQQRIQTLLDAFQTS
ncbi:MAG: DUF4058 family protein [Aggregatilineales bacterium]